MNNFIQTTYIGNNVSNTSKIKKERVQLGPIKVEVTFAYSKTQEAGTKGPFGEVSYVGNLSIMEEVTSKYY